MKWFYGHLHRTAPFWTQMLEIIELILVAQCVIYCFNVVLGSEWKQCDLSAVMYWVQCSCHSEGLRDRDLWLHTAPSTACNNRPAAEALAVFEWMWRAACDEIWQTFPAYDLCIVLIDCIEGILWINHNLKGLPFARFSHYTWLEIEQAPPLWQIPYLICGSRMCVLKNTIIGFQDLAKTWTWDWFTVSCTFF